MLVAYAWVLMVPMRLLYCQNHNCVRELRSLLVAQQEKVASLETEAAELKLLHNELKHEVLVLKVGTVVNQYVIELERLTKNVLG